MRTMTAPMTCELRKWINNPNQLNELLLHSSQAVLPHGQRRLSSQEPHMIDDHSEQATLKVLIIFYF